MSARFVAISPPSPAATFFVAYSEKHVASESPPIFRPRYALSNACAASSTTGTPSCHRGSRSHGWPARCTGMIAFVLSLTRSATRPGSMFRSASRTSANTGVAPVWTITFAVAGHVIGDVITSSPAPMSSATSARSIAAVPDATASTCSASSTSAARASSSAALGPVVSQPERRVSATAAISSSPIAGGWKPSRLRLRDNAGGLDLEADEALRPVGARQRLLGGVADGEDRARAVGAAAQGREHVTGLSVDADPADALALVCLLEASHSPQLAGRCDEEAHARPADAGLRSEAVARNLLSERGRDRELVEVDP